MKSKGMKTSRWERHQLRMNQEREQAATEIAQMNHMMTRFYGEPWKPCLGRNVSIKGNQ